MAYKTQHNLISFGRVATGVKQWAIGWTVAEAERAAARFSTRDTKQQSSPGVYALLAGVSSDVTSHR